MALTLINNTTDKQDAANHPLGYTDIKNRAGQELVDLMLVEHDANCKHLKTGAYRSEVLTFSGDGNATQEITLSNTDITPFFTMVWSGQGATPIYRLSNFADTHSVDFTAARITTGIIAEEEGQFTVGSSLNTNMTTYYYWVLGAPSSSKEFTGDTGAGSDPSWVQHGTPMLGGIASTMANRCEDTMFDAFDHEHNGTTGVHDTDPITGVYELDTYDGVDTDGTDIILSNPDLNIKFLLISGLIGSSITTVIRSESMSGDTTFDPGTEVPGFLTDRIQNLGTGEFEVGTHAHVNNSSYSYIYLAIGV
jgi:hypothetical protein